jgi:serine/threonine-protein kinase
MMARSRVFVVPVCLDATTEAAADVPESFRRAQWTRLPAGETPPAFVERVRRLLSPEAPAATRPPASAVSGAIAAVREPIRASRWAKPLLLAIVAVVAFAALAYVVANKFWVSKHATPEAAPAPAAAAAFNPPPHSIAVLPFVNISGDKEQEYFSDGLSEELLNSLSRIGELQVAARTSSFYFKGEHADLATIAHKLNVASVLEGSVRRSGQKIRITAQLNNAVSGFHLWSQTYDRDLSNVLELQTEIANAVASALKVTLLGDVAAKVELGGTHNPDAFDAYLRASSLYYKGDTPEEFQKAIALYTESIRMDPNYALAFAARSILIADFAWLFATGSEVRDDLNKAQADAKQAIALAPELAEAHLALAVALEENFDFDGAGRAYGDARIIAPRDSRIERNFGLFSVLMGHVESGITAARHAVAIDPLDRNTYTDLATVLVNARRYDEAASTIQNAMLLDPNDSGPHIQGGLAYYLLGKFPKAASTCLLSADNTYCQGCLALAYEKLGRHSDAQAMLAKIRASMGDDGAYVYTRIYAQWGDRHSALEWLETAMRLRSPWLEYLKQDPLVDPLRKEPRFQAIVRELKFPD